MYNVETLTVCRTIRPGISRMTITLYEDSDDKMLQVIKQIEKITEIISAKELDINESFWREVAIIKAEADPSLLENLKDRYDFEILDKQNHSLFIIQLAGTSQVIDDFLGALDRKAGNDDLATACRNPFDRLP